MIQNYFKIAVRNLKRDSLFTSLNILGLSVGLATGLLILLWVKDERSFDSYHPNIERIYVERANFKAGDEVNVWEGCPAPHAPYALREIPEVEKAVRVVTAGAPLIKYGEIAAVEKLGAFADTSFFQVFKTDLIAGNPAQPFGDIHSVVLTESLARKYFGASTELSSVLGKVLTIGKDPTVVTAIMRDYPDNTSLKYDYIRPYEYLKSTFEGNIMWKSREEDWGNFGNITYFLLKPGASVSAVEQKLGNIQHTHHPADQGSFYTLQAFEKTHLYAADGDDTGAQTVGIMGIAALFILLIACINYINLATAKATKRAKEVGMRKAIGAKRSQLVTQFLVESSLVFLLSSALAIALAYLLLPYCNDIADKKLRIDWSDPTIPLLLSGVLGGALLLSSIYPAFVLSAFNPLLVMKGQLTTSKSGQANLRKGLVVLQFVCSSALLFAMYVIGQQMNYIQTRNLGFDRENVFQINLSESTYKNRDAMIRELESQPSILDVTSTSDNILQASSSTGDTNWEGKTDDNNLLITPVAIAPDYMRFFKMNLVSGTDFTGTQADSTAFIINETAAAQMGIGNPVGKRFTLWQTEGTVIGVVKDFNFASLRESIKPAIFFSKTSWHGIICVKTTGKDANKAVEAAATVWKHFDTSYPFDFAFMDESFHKMYKKEQRTTQLFKAFGMIALLISCLGLFGLSAFMGEQRRKEIGVRKVLGATVAGITGLLAKDFLKLVVIAIIIAAPVAYYFMNKWLDDFAYRIDMQWWMFAVASAAAVLIAFLTVGFQAVKAALANPVKSLRSE